MSEVSTQYPETKKRPSFSIITPTWGDVPALAKTLTNIIFQRFSVPYDLKAGEMVVSDAPEHQIRGVPCEREVIVVGDGYEEGAADVCRKANEFAKEIGQPVKVWYMHLRTHSGNGNIPRDRGLKRAKNDWVLFIDTGTGVSHDCFQVLAEAIEGHPDLRILTWDMVNILDPVPIVSSGKLLLKVDRSGGLPYVIPGNAAAVKREDAQSVEWPDVTASDWAYFSELWKKMFGVPENTAECDKAVGIIPWTITIAYAYRSVTKQRMPHTVDSYRNAGYGHGWKEAVSEVNEVVDPDGGNDGSAGADAPSSNADPEPLGAGVAEPVSGASAAR